MIFTYCSAHAMQFSRIFYAIKCVAAKIVAKLVNFEQKQRRIDNAQEMLTTFNDDPDLLKKGYNW